MLSWPLGVSDDCVSVCPDFLLLHYLNRQDDNEHAWKSKQLTEWSVPGLGKLGDHLSIHNNASGFFNAAAYSKLVLEDIVVP